MPVLKMMLSFRDIKEKNTFVAENRYVPRRAIPREFCENKDGTSGTTAISVM